jgi:hypothetical protein
MSLPRAEKITLAKSAAPPEISDKATVYVLDSTGYVKAQDGSNGFSCFVDRQTPLNQEPTCFDAEGSATTFPTRLFAEEQRAKGRTEDQIKAAIDAGYKTKKFLAPRKAGIVYMLWTPFICSFRRATARARPSTLDVLCAYATERISDRRPGDEHAPPDSGRTPTRHDRFRRKNQRHSLERRCLILVSVGPIYSFFGFASLRAISSTILGRNSASTLSTILAIAVGSLALNWGAPCSTDVEAWRSADAGSTSRNSSLARAGFAAAPAIESRMFFQLAAITSPSMV